MLAGQESLWASYQSVLQFEGIPLEEKKLQKDDIKLSFVNEGFEITSAVKLSWNRPEKTQLAFTEKVIEGRGFLYQLPTPKNSGTLLERATKVSLKDNKIKVSLDKESLPLDFDQPAESKQENHPVSQQKQIEKKLVLALGCVSVVGLFLFLGILFIRRKRGDGTPWLQSLFSNAKYKQGPLLEVISKHTIGPKRQIIVVRAGGEYLLVGCSGENMSLLSKIDQQSVDEENDLLEEEVERKLEAEL